MEALIVAVLVALVFVAVRVSSKKAEKARFGDHCEEIYSHIRKESDDSDVEIAKELVEEEEDDTTEEGRKKIIDYLESNLINRMADSVIEKHNRVLKRKYNQCLFTDEYGVERLDKWPSERNYFVVRVLLPQLEERCRECCYTFKEADVGSLIDSSLSHSVEYWENFVDRRIEFDANKDEIHRDLDLEDSYDELWIDEFDDSMSGLEYERYVADLVESGGWKSIVTPSTGDHGADVIATDGTIRVAIQCKLYSSPVGNKSVQEAYSAKDYYECDFAVVVSNADFTTAARQVANSLNVALMHHEDVAGFLRELSTTEVGE